MDEKQQNKPDAEQTPDDVAPPGAETLDIEAELQALRNELNDANDRALRAAAELENYRKRMLREMADERKYASIDLMRDLLAVADNLERAIEAAERDGASGALLEGVRMVLAQFNAILGQHHCQKMEPIGQPFDPNLHEAVMQEASSEHPPGTVTRVVRTGYQLHDRVVRPAQVFVSKGAE